MKFIEMALPFALLAVLVIMKVEGQEKKIRFHSNDEGGAALSLIDEGEAALSPIDEGQEALSPIDEGEAAVSPIEGKTPPFFFDEVNKASNWQIVAHIKLFSDLCDGISLYRQNYTTGIVTKRIPVQRR